MRLDSDEFKISRSVGDVEGLVCGCVDRERRRLWKQEVALLYKILPAQARRRSSNRHSLERCRRRQNRTDWELIRFLIMNEAITGPIGGLIGQRQ